MFHRIAGALALALTTATTICASAQDFPSKPVQIVVPFPAGGLVDAAARQLQPELEKAFGRNVIIDNRAGAAGVVGTQAVVRAEPDGHTLLMVASTHAVTPAINTKLPYDTVADLAGVGIVIRDPLVFVVNPKVEARTLTEFVALAKAKPDSFNYSSPGFGSQSQFVSELFAQVAGVKLTHVPFRGGAPALQATVQGDTQFTVISAQLSLPQIEGGTLRPLAVGGDTRLERLPAVPTLKETGFGDVAALQWVGLFAPSKTPRVIIERLNAVLNETLKNESFAQRVRAQGMTPSGGPPQELDAIVAREVKLWKDVAASTGMKLE